MQIKKSETDSLNLRKYAKNKKKRDLVNKSQKNLFLKYMN